MTTLPPLLRKAKKARRTKRIRCQAHLKWVRQHACSVPGCQFTPIEAAHIRLGTDGSTGEKPGDQWTISLCPYHHGRQHAVGEKRFASAHSIDLMALAEEFARQSPHRDKLK